MATNKAAEAMLNGKYQHGWNASLTDDGVQLHVCVLCKCARKREMRSFMFFDCPTQRGER